LIQPGVDRDCPVGVARHGLFQGAGDEDRSIRSSAGLDVAADPAGGRTRPVGEGLDQIRADDRKDIDIAEDDLEQVIAALNPFDLGQFGRLLHMVLEQDDAGCVRAESVDPAPGSINRAKLGKGVSLPVPAQHPSRLAMPVRPSEDLLSRGGAEACNKDDRPVRSSNQGVDLLPIPVAACILRSHDHDRLKTRGQIRQHRPLMAVAAGE